MSVPRSVALPSGVERATVEAASGRLAALRAGAAGGGRPALLVPGFTGSKEDFLPLLPLLADAGHPVVALDLRGQYESGGPDDEAPYRIGALGADVAALTRRLWAGRPVHLLGHSFGGLVCRRALLEHRAAARSLVLVGSGPAALDGQRAALLRLLRPVLLEQGLPALYEASEALAAQDPQVAAAPPQVREFLRRRFLANSPTGLLVMSDALLHEPDLVGALAALGLPTMVLHGEGDDAWPPPVQRHMAERLGARYEIVPDALHSPAVEAPETTAQMLLEFWRLADADIDRPG